MSTHAAATKEGKEVQKEWIKNGGGGLGRRWKDEGRCEEIGKCVRKKMDNQGETAGGLRFENKKGSHKIMTKIKLYDRSKEKCDKEMEKE